MDINEEERTKNAELEARRLADENQTEEPAANDTAEFAKLPKIIQILKTEMDELGVRVDKIWNFQGRTRFQLVRSHPHNENTTNAAVGGMYVLSGFGAQEAQNQGTLFYPKGEIIEGWKGDIDDVLCAYFGLALSQFVEDEAQSEVLTEEEYVAWRYVCVPVVSDKTPWNDYLIKLLNKGAIARIVKVVDDEGLPDSVQIVNMEILTLKDIEVAWGVVKEVGDQLLNLHTETEESVRKIISDRKQKAEERKVARKKVRAEMRSKGISNRTPVTTSRRPRSMLRPDERR